MKIKKNLKALQMLLLFALITFSMSPIASADEKAIYDIQSIPIFEEYTWVTLDKNKQMFSEDLLTTTPYVQLSSLDELGRPGVVVACLGPETIMADYDYTPPRDSYEPIGWQDIKDTSSSLPLYVCTRLIQPCLYPDLDFVENVFTATKTMSTWELFPFENGIYNYIKETGNHVILRLTPVYEGSNLLCSGVLIEEWSVEEQPANYNKTTRQKAFVYNAEPNMTIDYLTGNAWANDQEKNTMGVNSILYKAPGMIPTKSSVEPSLPQISYVLNTNTKKFHYPYCASVDEIKASNRSDYTGTRDEVISMGFSPCGRCKP